MSAVDYNWDDPEITDKERRLINAYQEVGNPLDSLVYTEAFDRLVAIAGLDDTREAKRDAFLTLANLRKRGRLPRLIHTE